MLYASQLIHGVIVIKDIVKRYSKTKPQHKISNVVHAIPLKQRILLLAVVCFFKQPVYNFDPGVGNQHTDGYCYTHFYHINFPAYIGYQPFVDVNYHYRVLILLTLARCQQYVDFYKLLLARKTPHLAVQKNTH